MTTDPLYLADAHLRHATATVTDHTADGGVVLDRSLFYPTGGGQPGDTGALRWPQGEMAVAATLRGGEDTIALMPREGAPRPAIGTAVTQEIDWPRRLGHMKVHTALHLLSVVVPLPVTGGSISDTKGRLDFAMPEAPSDKTALEQALNDLIARDLPVTEAWITQDELDANPGLVKTLRVAPPRGAGRVRLIRIGQGDEQVDLQPCGGTHVASTAAIGKVRLGKIEKKGRENRRLYLHLAP
ncbi:MAG: alanyl-tRNA editing protein [Rhodobacteraceae bacterium]|nr:alanyl-tRNA editing protein [Paracoccaceae bacterium]